MRSVSWLNYYTKKPIFFRAQSYQLMSIKKLVSFLFISALLVLPSGIVRADDIDVQTPNVRVTVGRDGGINIQSKPSRVIVIPHHRVPGSSLGRQRWPKLNRTITHNTRIKKTTQCHQSSYSRQSTQTSGSGRRASQTQSSTTFTTTVCP